MREKHLARTGIVPFLAGSAFILSIGALFLSALGRYWAPLDILAHFSGHLFGIALVSVLAMLIPRFGLSILGVGFLVVPLVHAGMSNLVYSGARSGPQSTASSIKLVSLNMWGGHSDLERIGKFLRSSNADIVVLAEYSEEMRPLLQQLKSVYPNQKHCSSDCDMALLSKRRWVISGAQARSDSKPKLIWATFSYGTTPLTVVGTHLRKPIDSPGGKAREIDWLAMRLRKFSGAVVLAGDLNSTPWSLNFRKLVNEAGLHRARGIYPTWPASSILPPQLAIDHVLVSDGVTINELRVGRRVSSDHLPVVAELTLTDRRTVRVSGFSR